MSYVEALRRARANSNGTRNWFSIRNLAEGEAELFLYDVIGEAFGGGVKASELVRELSEITAEKIIVRINCPGGDVNDALAIRNALIGHPATIETHIDSAAYSSASWVALAGDKVIMSPHATMMIHEPYDITIGDAEAFRKEAEMLDMFGDEIAAMYAEKAGGSREEWRGRMREETWYTDQGAVDAGLADEVEVEVVDVGADVAVGARNTFDASILSCYPNCPPDVLERFGSNCDDCATGCQCGAGDLSDADRESLERVRLEHAARQARGTLRDMRPHVARAHVALNVIAAAEAAVSLAADDLGIDRPAVRWFLEPPSGDEGVLGYARDETVWLNAKAISSPGEVVVTVAHETMHVAQWRAGNSGEEGHEDRERQATEYEEEFVASRMYGAALGVR